ncbi:MAG: AraC family transcriptional regulator [Pseudomonadota bacterium]
MTDSSVNISLIQRLHALVANAGFSPEQLYAVAELPQQENSTPASFNEADIPKLLQSAAMLTNDPGLIIKLGQQLDITGLGTFGFALMSCANLGEALQLLLRYHPITGSGLSLQKYQLADGVALRIKSELGNPLQQQLATELAVSQIYSTGGFLINQPIDAGEIHFTHPAPHQQAAYAAVFCVPTKFSQDYNQFIIPAHILRKKISTANPAVHVIFQQQCEDMLRGLNRIENFSATVRRRLILAGGTFPDIKQVASQLHVSERTLKRRLMNESTSFRALCNEVKNVLACQYLATTEMTVAEIASLLDYTETVSFRRAFVRWNGMTPSAYRASLVEF